MQCSLCYRARRLKWHIACSCPARIKKSKPEQTRQGEDHEDEIEEAGWREGGGWDQGWRHGQPQLEPPSALARRQIRPQGRGGNPFREPQSPSRQGANREDELEDSAGREDRGG